MALEYEPHISKPALGKEKQKALGCGVLCVPDFRCKHADYFFFGLFFFSFTPRGGDPVVNPPGAQTKPELQKSRPRLPLPESGRSDSAFAEAKRGKREGPAGDLPVGQRGARCWES